MDNVNHGAEPENLPSRPLQPEILPAPAGQLDQGVFYPDEKRYVDAVSRPLPRRRRLVLPLILFVVTCISTYVTGVNTFEQHPVGAPNPLPFGGLLYAAAVMAILGAHEMGHFLQSVRYKVPASLPFFIPMPISPFGTMGAVIVQQAGVANRKAMFDIAISGPLAGLVLALPITYWGILHAQVVNLPLNQPVVLFGDPLLVKWMTSFVHGPLQPGQEIALNPLLFAGWVGIFITGLNLIPIGQLDGGHILYTLLRKKAHVVARVLFFFAVFVVIYGGTFVDSAYYGWTLMVLLLWKMGTKHPPTADDYVPLGTPRIILGWLTLLFIIIGFTPTPMYEVRVEEKKPEPAASMIDVVRN